GGRTRFSWRRKPRSSQSTQSQDFLCALCDLCGDRLLLLDRQLDPSHSKPIAAGDVCALHALAVDECAVRAREVLDFQSLVAGSQAAMKARNKRAIDDEIGACGPADRLDGA